MQTPLVAIQGSSFCRDTLLQRQQRASKGKARTPHPREGRGDVRAGVKTGNFLQSPLGIHGQWRAGGRQSGAPGPLCAGQEGRKPSSRQHPTHRAIQRKRRQSCRCKGLSLKSRKPERNKNGRKKLWRRAGFCILATQGSIGAHIKYCGFSGYLRVLETSMDTIAAKIQMSNCPTDTIKVLELNVRELLGIHSLSSIYLPVFWGERLECVCSHFGFFSLAFLPISPTGAIFPPQHMC